MKKIILFDWGDTLMRDFPNQTGKMYTWQKVEAMPNSINVLKELFLSFDCYVATNAKESNKEDILKALRRVGLDKYFKGIFCYREIGYEKSSEKYFNTIIEKLAVSVTSITMVGDNLKLDIEGAQNAGINAILYDPDGKYPNFSGNKIDDLLMIKKYEL